LFYLEVYPEEMLETLAAEEMELEVPPPPIIEEKEIVPYRPEEPLLEIEKGRPIGN